MFILAHRGYWQTPAQKNALPALLAALDQGWGLETDVRDCCGRLVVSHDPPAEDACPLETLLAGYRDRGATGWLALNIKADGLARPLKDMLGRYGIARYVVFDMSVPELRNGLLAGLPCLTRLSDLEPHAALAGRAAGYWIDGFERDWSDWDFLRALLEQNKLVCLVSPELHGRDCQAFWAALNRSGLTGHANLGLCTDLPQQAQNRFIAKE